MSDIVEQLRGLDCDCNDCVCVRCGAINEIERLQAIIDADKWQPIETAPEDRPFLVAVYAPTNWAYMVYHVTKESVMIPKRRELSLRNARYWRELMEAPE